VADIGLDQLSTPNLRVRLIGPFELFAGGATTPLRLPAGKATTVTELLTVRRGSLVSVDAIIDVLWGENAPTAAAQNVASLVSRLRRTLGAERISGGHTGYRFETGDCWVDVDAAAELIREAESQLRAGRPALAAAASAQARRLLERGSFLEDERYAAWAEEGRREAERLLRRAWRASWTAALALGEHRIGLEAATLAVDSDNLDEEAHRARMQALYLAGNAAAALAAYEQLRGALVAQLGADPGPETEALYLAILRSEPIGVPGNSSPRGLTVPRHSDAIVGRSHELEALWSCWSTAVGGRPGMVVICGAAGSGKTRLATELARQAKATGAAALWARCHPAERSLLMQPLLESLRVFLSSIAPGRSTTLVGPWAGTLTELIPELGPVLAVQGYRRVTPELEHRRSLEAVAALFERLSRDQPVLLILDDLHNAGDSTLEAVHFLLHRVTSEPILVVATVASDDADNVLAVLGTQLEVVSITPLSLAAVEELARRLDARNVDPVEIHALTGGHAQFVVEALRLAAETHAAQQPDSLQDAVLERVARAGHDVEEFLRVAAVIGTSFELDFAAELADMPVQTAVRLAEHAVRAGLLTTAGSRFEFAGSIIRDVLYATTRQPVRIVRHRGAAAKLADRPESAAAHHAAAGDWAMAHEAWRAAAEQAILAFAIRDAERLLTEAVSAAERATDRRARASALMRRGQMREELADYTDAQDDHTAALAIARALGDDALEAQALERLGWTAYYGRDSGSAADLAARAADLAESAAAAPEALPSALVLVGRIRHWAGDIDGAAEAYEQALEMNPDTATLPSVLSCLGALLEHGDRFVEARRTLDLAAAESTRNGAFRPLLRTLFFGGLARGNLGDFGGALRTLERKRRLLEEFDVHFYRARTDTVLSWVWRELGELEKARRLAEQAVGEAREVKAGSLQVEQELHGLLAIAECALDMGDEATAAELMDEASLLFSAWLPFRWRAELRYRDVRCRLVPNEAEGLLDQARSQRSRKYEALALAHMGRPEQAVVAAGATGSDLLVARVAPPAQARVAFDRLASALPSVLRHGFVTRGSLARGIAARE
jgi:DNA-binding SARP family transcriptional activator